MSILVTCANGHNLRAADKKAGTIGRCPACGAEVKIPLLSKAPSESSIMRILGVGQELRRKMEEYDAQEAAKAEMEQNNSFDAELQMKQKNKKKVCPSCDWEIDEGYKICPHCRHYFMT